jgi:hypothetical protein
MTLAFRTEKTRLLGESKANPTADRIKDRRNFRPSNNLLKKNRKTRPDKDEKIP